MLDIDALKHQPATLYTALDISSGNKAITEVKEGLLIVARLVNYFNPEFVWYFSCIKDGKRGGPRRIESSILLGAELQKYGIEYLGDRVWLPL